MLQRNNTRIWNRHDFVLVTGISTTLLVIGWVITQSWGIYIWFEHHQEYCRDPLNIYLLATPSLTFAALFIGLLSTLWATYHPRIYYNLPYELRHLQRQLQHHLVIPPKCRHTPLTVDWAEPTARGPGITLLIPYQYPHRCADRGVSIDEWVPPRSSGDRNVSLFAQFYTVYCNPPFGMTWGTFWHGWIRRFFLLVLPILILASLALCLWATWTLADLTKEDCSQHIYNAVFINVIAQWSAPALLGAICLLFIFIS